MRPEVMYVGFDGGNCVYVNPAVDEPDVVARHSDHALHKMHARIDRVMEHDNVSALHLAVRQDTFPETVGSEMQFVHQKVVAD